MKFHTLLLLFLTWAAQAQVTLSGTVTDSNTGEPLPFATISRDGITVIGDVDGNFVLEQAKLYDVFTVSYTGYKPHSIKITPGRVTYMVTLEPYTQTLEEVAVTNDNPANRIIKMAIRSKILNDPQQKLNSFKYKTYNRLIVTANPDSISGALDSIYVYERAGRRLKKIDSTDYKFKRTVERRHLYQTEKISEYKFNRDQGLKEEVLATRMAGFKQPLYEIIGLQLQSYSVYGKNIELMETRYAGPLASNAFSEYRYKILDTVTIDNRKACMIFFTPRNSGKKKKMEGVVYIDMETYGVAKAIFRVSNVLDITSTHFFTYEPSQQLWFPDRKTLKIVKGNNKSDIKILGETIKFDAEDIDRRKREKEPSDFVYLYSESDNYEKEFNIPLTIKRAAVAIDIKESAIDRPEEYWEQYRKDTLDVRSMTTYAAMDSIVAKEHWEQRIFLGKKIINGYLPLGPFDINLRQLISYNNYEGFRPGLGFVTNDRFAETFRITAYTAYGTKDGQFKYSLGGAVRLGKFTNSWVGGSYTDDVREIASTSFATDKKVFKIYDPRPINISTFYNHQTYQLYVETRILPKTESMWQLTRSRIDPKFSYLFSPFGKDYTLFNITTATAAIQWNPFSDYMQTPQGRLEVEKRFPKFTFQFTQSISDVLESDFTFGKLDFRAEYEKKYLNGQRSSVMVQTGVVTGNAPLTHLYSTSPNNLDKMGVIERITFAGKNSFETMYFNEFFSSQYITAQVKHGLRKFTLFGGVKLAPVFVTRAAFGSMRDKHEHMGIEYKTLEKGFYESGVELNEIYKFFGLTFFYRYGPYKEPTFDRNIAIKVSFVFNLF